MNLHQGKPCWEEEDKQGDDSAIALVPGIFLHLR